MKLKVIAIDDESEALEKLRIMLKQIDFVDEVRDMFMNPMDFLRVHAKLDYDVCLLDIKMNGHDEGISLGATIKRSGKDVVFITGNNYEPELIFETGAIGFIKKPVREDKLETNLRKVLDRKTEQQLLKKKNQVIELKTDGGKSLKIHSNDIVSICSAAYAEHRKGDESDSVLLLKNGKDYLLIDTPLRYFEELSDDFKRVNQKVVVNKTHIKPEPCEKDVIVMAVIPENSKIRTEHTISKNYWK